MFLGNTYFRMKCLTFGVTSSPFVATRVLHKLAEKVENQRVPDTTQFYVDDCLSGGATVSEAAELVDSLTTALLSAGMILRKFRSNDRELLQHIPEHLREEPEQVLAIKSADKTLGIHWDPGRDKFRISVPVVDDMTATKKMVASIAAQVYDLLRWFSPFTITAKILLQQLWSAGVDWDDPITNNLQ